jgi:hypothetical protein
MLYRVMDMCQLQKNRLCVVFIFYPSKCSVYKQDWIKGQ